MGGLGNQLFQYAAGFLQRKITNGRLLFTPAKHKNKHDVTDYRTVFGLEKYDTELPVHRIDLYQEDGFAIWDPEDYRYPVVLLYGYFQNYTVLKCILPEFKETVLEKLKSQREISLHKYTIPPSSGFLHVRRGDYIAIGNWDTIGINYYKKAVAQLPNIKNWFIFSDDIEWVKTQEFFQNMEPIYIEETDPLMSLALMSEIHDGAIIANSTFSWWGAYLGGSDSVIYPKVWFDKSTPDLFPEKWIGI